jgi:hypothetical protein
MNLRLWTGVSLAVWAVLAFTPMARADTAKTEESQYIEVHAFDPLEPSTIGYTWDDDDVPFLDIKLSVRVSLLRPWIHDKTHHILDLNAGLTGRIGQYIGRRKSSPVIGKRYNPELFLRIRYFQPGIKNDNGHVDLGYAHESNGQSITTLEEFQQAQANAENPEFAYDQISRGWDYLHVGLKTPDLIWTDQEASLNLFVNLKYFLSHGLVQGKAEEFNDDWEIDKEGKPRRKVNGLEGLLKYVYCYAPYENNAGMCMKGFKLAVIYETGYCRAGKYNTGRGELGGKFWGLPEIMLWASRGYNSDLAQYYKKVDSYGVAIEVGAF